MFQRVLTKPGSDGSDKTGSRQILDQTGSDHGSCEQVMLNQIRNFAWQAQIKSGITSTKYTTLRATSEGRNNVYSLQFISLNKMLSNVWKVWIVNISFTAVINNGGIGKGIGDIRKGTKKKGKIWENSDSNFQNSSDYLTFLVWLQIPNSVSW